MDKKNTLDESLMWDMFGTTMESGIPVLMALNLVRDTFPAYKEEIQHLHDVIREGDSCAIALNKYKDSFHPLTIPLIDVGEETGALPEMLFKCSEIAKKNNSNESTLWYSLGTLTDAGMPILRSMRIAKKAFPNYDVELANIAESIESGSTITESLEAKPCSFNPLVKYIIERGEYSGNLEGGFFRASNLVEYKENVDESIFYNPEQKDKLTFFKYAGCLLDEGIPLTRGLKIISDAVDEPYKSISNNMMKDIYKGCTFSETIAKNEMFSPFELNMIRAGEAGGVLEEVVERIGTHLKEVYKTKAMIKAQETIYQISNLG